MSIIRRQTTLNPSYAPFLKPGLYLTFHCYFITFLVLFFRILWGVRKNAFKGGILAVRTKNLTNSKPYLPIYEKSVVQCCAAMFLFIFYCYNQVQPVAVQAQDDWGLTDGRKLGVNR